MATDKTIPRTRDAYAHFTPVTLRYSDQDPMQHINNVAITAMLESGRMHLLRAAMGDALERQADGIGMVLARLSIDYLAEIRFPDPVEVGGRIERVGGRSLTSRYAVFQGDRCCVVSESVNVFFDTVSRRSAAPSDELLARLEAYVAAP